MWTRPIVAAIATVVAMAGCFSLASVGPAFAGGWAVTTVDALPPDGFRAEETYRLGYTIRQHGQTPVSGAATEIRIRSPRDGDGVAAFPGVPDGAPGHYVAEVRFPVAGEWAWEVTQGPFGVQSLGAVDVGAPATGMESRAISFERVNPAPIGLVAAVLLIALLASVSYASHVQRQRRTSTPASAHARHLAG